MNTKKELMGKRIRIIRNRLGISQEQFGNRLGGITKGSISGYESGDINPPIDVLIEVKKLGGVSLDWLITGTDAGVCQLDADYTKKTAEIASSYHLGNKDANRRLVENGNRPTVKNILLRKIVAWMDESFDGHDEEAFLFYEDIVRRYPTFSKFVSPELPDRNEAQKKRDQAAGA